MCAPLAAITAIMKWLNRWMSRKHIIVTKSARAMSQEIVLALDAMGGDQAPGMVLKGANIARLRYPDLRFV